MFFKMENNNKINSDLPYFRLGKVCNTMKTDIYESLNEYLILIDVPGFKKEDIKIIIDGEYLEVVATRNNDFTNETSIHNERYFGTATRKFFVGNISKNKIEATLQNGVLELKIPISDSFTKETEYIEIK